MTNFENHPLHPGEGTVLFISGGPIKETAQVEPFMTLEDPLAWPALTFGGFTLPGWSGNAKPGQQDFVYYPERRMAGNCRGLPNEGVEGILKLKHTFRMLSDMGVRTILQVTNLPHETPMDVIPRLVSIAASVNPTAIEVNLSCPNGKKEDGSFHPPLANNAEVSAEVMSAARQEVGAEICLGAKDSPHVTSLEDEVNEAEVGDLAISLRGIVDFLTGINTIGNQPFPELECAGGRGGMSGPVVAEIAKQHLRLWQKHVPEIPYLSCGGVDSNNASTEIPERRGIGAMLVGGAQEFYRASQPHLLAERWLQ